MSKRIAVTGGAVFIGDVLHCEPIAIHSGGQRSRDIIRTLDSARAWIDAIARPTTYGDATNIGAGMPVSVKLPCGLVLYSFDRNRSIYPILYQDAQPGDLRVFGAVTGRSATSLNWTHRSDFSRRCAKPCRGFNH